MDTDFGQVGFLMNALDKEQSIRAHGNWFTFKPKQIKMLRSSLVQFVIKSYRDQGFVEVDQTLAGDPAALATPEGKAALEEKVREGVTNYVDHLNKIVSNLTVSLKRDLDMANIKASPVAFATKQEKEAIREIEKYKKLKLADNNKETEELEKTLKSLGA